MDQGIMQVLGELNQQHETLQEQLKIVDQQLNELQVFGEELNVLSKQNNPSILAPLGKAVFAQMNFDAREKVWVEVGAGYFVRKDLVATKKVVEEQAARLHEFKAQISIEINKIAMRLEELLTKTQNQ